MFLLITSLVQEGGPQASLRQVWVGFVSIGAIGSGQWRAGLKVVPLEERAGDGRTAAGAREADWVSVGDGSQMGSRLAHSRAVRHMDSKSLLKAYCVLGHG